jgi:hypothetical protein
MRKRWIQDPVTLELVPAEEYNTQADSCAYIIGDIEPFVATGTAEPTLISSRKQLRQYCNDNGLLPAGEVTGLPPRPRSIPYRVSNKEVEAMKRHMAERFE